MKLTEMLYEKAENITGAGWHLFISPCALLEQLSGLWWHLGDAAFPKSHQLPLLHG